MPQLVVRVGTHRWKNDKGGNGLTYLFLLWVGIQTNMPPAYYVLLGAAGVVRGLIEIGKAGYGQGKEL